MNLDTNVLLILNNYRRPQNFPRIIEAWKQQTVPPRIVVVDNSPADSGPYPSPLFAGADDVWRFADNAGCSSHFAPAFIVNESFEFVLFADDDLLPGKGAIEYAVNCADKVGCCFSTIGQCARKFELENAPGGKYNPRLGPLPSDKYMVRCDTTCRVHLVRYDLLHHILAFKHKLLSMFNKRARAVVGLHDDLLMSLGIQLGTGYSSYILPVTEPENRLIKTDLDDDVALWRRPNHRAERCDFVDMAIAAGWRRATG
jgi:hypothetical protein